MEDALKRIWLHLQKCAGSSDEIPIVTEAELAEALGDPSVRLEPAVVDLCNRACLAALDDRELQDLSRHKKLPGSFLILDVGGGNTRIVKVISCSQMRRALIARREFLSRQLANQRASLLPLAEASTANPDNGTPFSDRVLVILAEVAEALIATGEHPSYLAACTPTSDEVRQLEGMAAEDIPRIAFQERVRRIAQISALLGWGLTPQAKAARLRSQASTLADQIRSTESDLSTVSSFLATLDSITSAAATGTTRPSIPKTVQQEVWRRDEGRCVQCGSQERLEFDHIIPLSKGGANTARNLQLLCEACNRAKGNRI